VPVDYGAHFGAARQADAQERSLVVRGGDTQPLAGRRGLVADRLEPRKPPRFGRRHRVEHGWCGHEASPSGFAREQPFDHAWSCRRQRVVVVPAGVRELESDLHARGLQQEEVAQHGDVLPHELRHLVEDAAERVAERGDGGEQHLQQLAVGLLVEGVGLEQPDDASPDMLEHCRRIRHDHRADPGAEDDDELRWLPEDG
jgi:hypothetical protein